MAKAAFDKDGIALKPGDVTVYNFDSMSREFLSSSVEFLAAGVGIPANSCITEPPGAKAGFTVCRAASGDKWEYVADHRGETVYMKESGSAILISKPGDYPDDVTLLAPSTPYDRWSGSGWETDRVAEKSAQTLDAVAEKSRLLTEARAAISLWQTELQLGIIGEEDKPRLIAWVQYIRELQDVEPSSVPDIQWPVRPE